MYTLGCFFGSLSCISLGDQLGRIRTIQLGCVVTIVGTILQASSYSLAQMIVGRFVAGLGFGAITATAPNWQSECSSAHHRGAAVLYESLFISLGLVVQGWLNLGLSFTTTSISWRLPLAIPVIWALLVLSTVWSFPESPRWLMKKGHIAEARFVISSLEDKPEDSEEVKLLQEEITTSLEITGSGKFRDVFTNSEERLFHRTCLAATGLVFQQMCGINAIAFYVTTLFQVYLGLSSVNARILSASVFTWQTLCAPIGILTVDRFGRRKLMTISALGMGICMAIVAGTGSQPSSRACVGVAGAFVFLFCMFFPVGFLGLPFLYATEMSPLSVRVPITSISTGTSWLFNFLVAEITPVGLSSLGSRFYIIWACINLFLILPGKYIYSPYSHHSNLV
jgi:sugar porter (SP) family MFS transporter